MGFAGLSRGLPQPPNLRSNLCIPFRRTSGHRVKPTNKFFIDNPAHVGCRLASTQAWQDAACLRLILIWVNFKVDAHWIVAEWQCCRGVEQIAVLFPESFTLPQNLFARCWPWSVVLAKIHHGGMLPSDS
jgi:hypothetical protein